MQSGVFWGYVGMVEGLVGRIREECGETMGTVATGGLAPLFAGATEAIEKVDPDLTLWGLASDLSAQPQSMKAKAAGSASRWIAPSSATSKRALFRPARRRRRDRHEPQSLRLCAAQWLMIDCGVTFGDDAQPGSRS